MIDCRCPPLSLHLVGNIFYLMEYREIFLTLLRKYDGTTQPQSYLKDLVESTHLFLRMLERFCKGRRNLVVQVQFGYEFLQRTSLNTASALDVAILQKKRVKRKKSKKDKKQAVVERTPEALAETWKNVEEQLKGVNFQVSVITCNEKET